MKKTLIVAALAAVSTGGALAQSSVTIYGRLNVSGENQALNGRKTYQLANNASRWGLRGVEDLGGGLKAGFQLESGFDPSNGAAGNPYFGRQSEVNLGGGFGMVRLGNFTSEAYYATADYISLHNHDTGSSADALYAYLGRNTNKISYRLPTFVNGLTVEGAVSAGEAAPGQTRSYDFAINYAAGPLQLGVGGERNNAKEQYAARILLDFSPFIIGAYYQRDEEGFNPVLGATNYGNRNTYRLSGAYNVGAFEFHLNGGYADDYSKINNSSAKQYTGAINYNLSKRTKVYVYATKLEDDSEGTLRIYGGGFRSYAVGVRHNF